MMDPDPNRPMDEPAVPRNRAERRRQARRLNGSGLWVTGDSAEPAAPPTPPPVTAGGEPMPMTPALAADEIERLGRTVEMVHWRVVELWLFVSWHFGPRAW